MNLHRATSQGDWTRVLPQDRNPWQRLAASTRGFITPGNIVTTLGLILVLSSLVRFLGHDYWSGLLLLAIGRLLDIADGFVANRTGTKSPIGEAYDAGVDKLTVALTLPVFAISGILTWGWLLILALPHLVIGGPYLYGRWRNLRLHPSRLGKVSMALLWLALIGFALTVHLKADQRLVLNLPFDLIAVWSLVVGALAARGYLKQIQER